MTDWLEALLKLVSFREENSEDILSVPHALGELPRPAAPLPRGEADYPSALGAGALPLLYRQVTESTRGGNFSHSGTAASGREQVIVVQEGSPAPGGLTAGALDRAVRRDSRRYDGGMTIY